MKLLLAELLNLDGIKEKLEIIKEASGTLKIMHELKKVLIFGN